MNKLDVLEAVKKLDVATSKNVAKHFRISQSRAAWFLLRLYRQALLTRELQEQRRGRPGYIYRLTHRGRERMRYLETNYSKPLLEE